MSQPLLHTAYRTNNCGELNLSDVGKEVRLCGWVQRKRDLGGMTFIDLRDRYGITQLTYKPENLKKENLGILEKLQREDVISIAGKVVERESKNKKMPTGEIEIDLLEISLLNKSETPPFTIETSSDGGEELRMKFRYLDLRREPLQKNLALRHQMAQETRNYLNSQSFYEIETPFLIKSTPEGARDFVVPSRMNQGQFYALPQSPQTFKQLLMLSGFDRYYQIVKCFRDEDLRADRQPEFTQIDCEMCFVNRDDVMRMFEGMVRHLFKKVKNIDLGEVEVMSYKDAMETYGTDRPDTRPGMEFVYITKIVQGKGFNVFDESELVVGISVPGCADYSRKQLDQLTDFVRKPQIGGKGLVYVKCNTDSTFKSSVDKFFIETDLRSWSDAFKAKSGDLLLIVSGEANKTRHILHELRLEMAGRLGLRTFESHKALWVVDFPLLEWDEETKRYYAMHHPFTSPNSGDLKLLDTSPGEVKANAYDLVINGVEVGGGSIRINDQKLQKKIFEVLGFTDEEAKEQFGFLTEAFRYGAPPHGGIAFGFDRLCALMGGSDSIRDYIAFPKNNAGRDVMLDAPAGLSKEQLNELGLKSSPNEK